MVVNVDMTHPFPGSREDTPIVGGAVAGIDEKCGKWHAKRLLPGRRMDGGS